MGMPRLRNYPLALHKLLFKSCILGFGWIQNLTLPDQTWIVPCVVGLSYLTVNEINHNRYKKDFVNQGNCIKMNIDCGAYQV